MDIKINQTKNRHYKSNQQRLFPGINNNNGVNFQRRKKRVPGKMYFNDVAGGDVFLEQVSCREYKGKNLALLL